MSFQPSCRPSPLTGASARTLRIGSSEGFWRLVREEEGLEYALDERLSPRTEDEARQLLLVARYCARRGRTVLFMRQGDRGAFAKERPDLHLRNPVEFWFVRD